MPASVCLVLMGVAFGHKGSGGLHEKDEVGDGYGYGRGLGSERRRYLDREGEEWRCRCNASIVWFNRCDAFFSACC